MICYVTRYSESADPDLNMQLSNGPLFEEARGSEPAVTDTNETSDADSEEVTDCRSGKLSFRPLHFFGENK